MARMSRLVTADSFVHYIEPLLVFGEMFTEVNLIFSRPNFVRGRSYRFADSLFAKSVHECLLVSALLACGGRKCLFCSVISS